jgi:hypothetical protein
MPFGKLLMSLEPSLENKNLIVTAVVVCVFVVGQVRQENSTQGIQMKSRQPTQPTDNQQTTNRQPTDNQQTTNRQAPGLSLRWLSRH